MGDKKLKKTVCVASVTLAVTAAGTAIGVAAYNSADFTPSEDKRDIQINQVHFAQNGETSDQKDNNRDDKSSILEKDSAEENFADNNSGYLFDKGNNNLPENINTAVINGNNDGMSAGQGSLDEEGYTADNIYDITDRRDDADIIINVPGTSSGQKQDDSSQESGNSGNGGFGSTDEDDSGDSDDTWYDYAGSAKDPQMTKPMPAVSTLIPSESYKEGTGDKPNIDIYIREGMIDSPSSLYKGQSVDEYSIFCSLETYVYSKDEQKIYVWGTDALGSYVRIKGISFDGGQSWNKQFPVNIPTDIDGSQMLIDVEYRLSLNNESWTQQQVFYVPRDNKIFVLSEKLEQENQTISSDKIINTVQYPKVGDKMNLLAYQAGILGRGEIKMLFPGWRENGKLMSWFYSVQIGRHILEPSDCISLSEEYIVKMVYQWVKPDGTIEEKNTAVYNSESNTQNNAYCELQTLVDMRLPGFLTSDRGSSYRLIDELKVPKYIQAVVLERYLHANTIYIPDTVMYIRNDGNMLRVNNAYIVDENNPNYSSKDGILYNKLQDEILGIPYNISEINIDSDIKKVNITTDNILNKIYINQDNLDDIPQMEFDNLRDCTVVVNDDILDDFLVRYGDVLMSGDNVVAASEDTSVTYRYKNGVVIGSDGTVRYISPNSGECILLPDDAVYVKADAFRDAGHVLYILLPSQSDVEFENGCFENCNINTILCNTVNQYNNSINMLENYGITDVEVILINISSEGYSYYTQQRDGGDVTVLVKVPSAVTSFDGTIENGTVNINIIGSNAFSECNNLEWVTLPDTVRRIGYKAFYNCNKVQGILIDTKDEITIADRAFEGCTSLRFIASNAMKATMENDYAPVISDSLIRVADKNMFYVLNDSEGYPDSVNKMQEVYGITRYRLEDIGGSMMLYGVDEYDESWLAIRSGKTVPKNVKLPEATTQIYSYAFSYADSTEGGFLINWDDINVFSINESAFRKSKLSGEIYIGTTDGSAFITIYSYAFAECEDITGVIIKDKIYYLGEGIFNSCRSLENVIFDDIYDMTASVFAGQFNDCDNLKSLTFNNINVPKIVIYGNTAFQFNYSWSKQEEQEKLRINVPKEAVNDYITDWRYAFSGYIYAYEDSYYLGMWNQIQNELIDFDNFIFPTDEEVDEVLESRLLEAENRLRMMLGLECVDEPTDLYRFSESGGMVTLRGVPGYSEKIDFTADYTGLPEGWYYDYFAKGAFSRASKLKNVVIHDNIAAIYSGAFKSAGSESDKVVLSFNGTVPVELICDEQGIPFDFGIDDSKLVLEVPAGCKASYVQEWSYRFAGYSDYWDIMQAVMAKFEEEGKDYTFDDIDNEINHILNPVQERLNKLIVEKGETHE